MISNISLNNVILPQWLNQIFSPKFPIDMILTIGLNHDNSLQFIYSLIKLFWENIEWKSYRPGDYSPFIAVPIIINFEQDNITDLNHHLKKGTLLMDSLTEAEIQVLKKEYIIVWFTIGYECLSSYTNIYDENGLNMDYHSILLVNCISSTVYKLEESTYFIPHDMNEIALSSRYQRYLINDNISIDSWNGCYRGKIGTSLESILSNNTKIEKDNKFKINLDKLIIDKESSIGKGSFGAIYKGTYNNENVAIKQFNKTKLTLKEKNELQDEASVMGKLESDFLIRLIGLSLENPPIVVMELAKCDLYSKLKLNH